MSELFGKPIAACPAGCGCLWRDNRDGTMSLFGENSSSCEVCEYATWNELIPLKIDRYSDTLFLSQRLQRVASMVDLKYLEMSDTQVCEVAGTILGEIARKLSELVRERDRLRDIYYASTELFEVAQLRGDNELPHPADDPLLWTARMQDAWDDLETALYEQNTHEES